LILPIAVLAVDVIAVCKQNWVWSLNHSMYQNWTHCE